MLDYRTAIAGGITLAVLLGLVKGLYAIRAAYGDGVLAIACGTIVILAFLVAYCLEGRWKR